VPDSVAVVTAVTNAAIENTQTVQSLSQTLINLTTFMSSATAAAVAKELVKNNPTQAANIASQIVTNNVAAAVEVTKAAIDAAPSAAAAIKTAAVAAVEATDSTVAQGVIDTIGGLPVSPS
jgi:hypothetical protein